jgi:hypothetical protein
VSGIIAARSWGNGGSVSGRVKGFRDALQPPSDMVVIQVADGAPRYFVVAAHVRRSSRLTLGSERHDYLTTS